MNMKRVKMVSRPDRDPDHVLPSSFRYECCKERKLMPSRMPRRTMPKVKAEAQAGEERLLGPRRLSRCFVRT